MYTVPLALPNGALIAMSKDQIIMPMWLTVEQHYLTVSAVSSDVPQVGHGIAKTRVRLKPHDDAGLPQASLYIHTEWCSDFAVHRI